ncbi:MAG: hypothetical protein WDO24_03620 [Pseudomonadota bacterium]
MADFRKQAPEIEVRITTGGAAAPFGDDWTCGIRLGNGAWDGLVAEPAVRPPTCCRSARRGSPSASTGPRTSRPRA